MHYVYAGPLERDISQYFRPQTSWQMDWQSEVSSFSGNLFPRIIAMSWSASSLFEVFFLFLQFFLPNVKLIVTMTWRAEMLKKTFLLQISWLRRDKRLQDILAAQICSTEQKRAAWRQKGIWGLASWLGQSKRERSSRIRWWWWWCSLVQSWRERRLRIWWWWW